MPKKRLAPVADISTGNSGEIQEGLVGLVGVDAMLRIDRGFRVKTTLEGKSAAELSRGLLPTLRRLEAAIVLRTEWTHGDKTERFVDCNPGEKREPADRKG